MKNMTKKLNLARKKFGRLLVIEKVEKPTHIKKRGSWWLCKCSCGNEVIVRADQLTRDVTKSCGCYSREIISGPHPEKRLDITGRRFGRLVAIRQHSQSKNNMTKWLCKCDCGKETIVAVNNLINGHTKSCGCLSREIVSKNHLKDLIGQKFGKLLVLEQAGRSKDGRVKWLCRCDCGNTAVVLGKNLLNSDTKSCGCLHKKKMFEIGKQLRLKLVGQKFGRLTVIKFAYVINGDSYWWCLCGCGEYVIIRGNNLTSKGTQSCGCLTRERSSERGKNRVGENSPSWIKDRSKLKNPFKRQIIKLFEFNQWREDIYKRDNYTCQKCSKKGSKLNAHHIIPFSEILSYYNITIIEEAKSCPLLFDINNGITLCKDCHNWVHSNENINKEFLKSMGGIAQCQGN